MDESWKIKNNPYNDDGLIKEPKPGFWMRIILFLRGEGFTQKDKK